MATHHLPIVGWQCKPDTSGEVYLIPLDADATNDQWDHLVFKFEGTGSSSNRIVIHGAFQVPNNYVGTATLRIVWATDAATTNAAAWDFDYRAVGGDGTESLDQSGTQETVNVDDAAGGAAWERNVATVALTDGNFAALDTVQFLFGRDKADAGDTLDADDAYLFGLFFQYDDA